VERLQSQWPQQSLLPQNPQQLRLRQPNNLEHLRLFSQLHLRWFFLPHQLFQHSQKWVMLSMVLLMASGMLQKESKT
jgi:hypothetical protein